ncbi:fasciclin domain-containing protein [Aureimonas endophytica]|nr:fasciclin domain-containing protein [Aureimonas endophytica]
MTRDHHGRRQPSSGTYQADVMQKNGVVHVIDTVLMPK